MFEKITDRARKVLSLANQEAQRFGHRHIETEDILLGLVREGSGVGANVIKNLGVDSEGITREVEKLTKRGSEAVSLEKLPLSADATKLIEYGQEEASNLKHNYLGTDHLLLGLLHGVDDVGTQVLTKMGLRLDEARTAVLDLLGAGGPSLADIAEGRPDDRPTRAEKFDAPSLVLLLDPGTATPDEIGQLLLEFSTLYRMLGGSGITFTRTDARELVFA